MRFFKLTHPRYATDREADKRNPVTTTSSHRIPGISCEECGPWSSSSRLRVNLLSHADIFADITFLPVADWMTARDRWARLLGVDPGVIDPGAKLGLPSGTCRTAITEDVVHPIPGEIWIATNVRDALAAAGLTGVSLAKVQLSPECDAHDFSELVVHGRAWRQGSTEENLRLCEICGRRGFPSPKNLVVDEARWDGSDFVLLDGNQNIIVVSERTAEVFSANAFTNVITEPIN